MRIDRVALVASMARQDLSSVELAKRAGLSRCTISAVRGGKTCSPTTAKKLAEILGSEILVGVD